MNRLTAILVFLVSCSGVFAQDTIKWSSDATVKTTWNQPVSSVVPFQFNGWMEVESHKEKDGQTTRVYFITRARWIKSQSFMADSLAARYQPLAQLYFDCYELESRRLQEIVNLPGEDTDTWDDLNESVQRARSRIASLRSVTGDGQNLQQVAYWRKWMDSALVATPRLSPPDWIPGKLRLGFDIGPGMAVYSGVLANYFNPTFGWGFGAGFFVSRFAFEYRALYANTTGKLDFKVGDFEFTDSNKLKINQSTFSLGYQVVNTHRFSVIPYIGLSTFRVLNRDVNPGSIFAKGRASVNVEAGLGGEWRFCHFYQNNNSQFFWKLFFKAGYAPVNYLNSIDGNAFKLQAGVGWSFRQVRNVAFEY